jgi:oxygen-independent coproporphyrinogen-3 oxidase
MSVAKLTDAGYEFIGMDHFAKPEDDLTKAFHQKKLYRNFQGYSTHAGTDLIGMGITSIGQLADTYAQNVKKEKEYFEMIDNDQLPIERGYQLNEDDLLRRDVITKVMCDFELDYAAIDKKYNIKFEDYFAWGLNNLQENIDDGLIIMGDRKFEVTQMGRLLIRNIAMNFDGYLERKEDTARYSRTV